MKSTSSIGKTLRDARTAKKMPLEQIEFETKIPIKILHKIEEDNFKSIEHEVYLKGYIKNFAITVGINPELIIAMYKRDYEHSNHKRVRLRKKQRNKSYLRMFLELIKSFIRPRKAIQASLFIVSIFALVFLYSFISQAFEKPYLKLDSPFEVTANYSGTFPTTENSIILSGITESDTILKLDSVPINLDASRRFTTDPIPIGSDQKTIQLTAENALGALSTIEIIVQKREPRFLNISFELSVLESTSSPVNILLDGESISNQELKAGELIAFEAVNYFEIKTNEPEKIQVLIEEQKYTLPSNDVQFRLNSERTEIIVESN